MQTSADRRPRAQSGRARLWALSLGVLVGCALLAEAVLRAAGLPRPLPVGWGAQRNVPPEERNELGFRGQPIRYAADDRVVVLLGDSQVEAATGACFDQMPERLLERALAPRVGGRVRVFSVGVQGWGTDQELLALRRYLERFRADLVALWLTPRNDVWNNTFPSSASGSPKPTFQLRKGRLVEPADGELVWGSRLATLLARRFGPTREERWEAFLPPPYRPLEGYAGPVGSLEEQWSTTARVLAFEDLDTGKSHLSMYLTPPGARLRYGIELTRRLVAEVEREALSHGAGLFLFTTSIEDSLRSSEPVVVRWHEGLYRASRAAFDANVGELLAGFDAAVVPVNLEDWAVGPEDKHLNARALAEAMEALAGQLAPRLAAR